MDRASSSWSGLRTWRRRRMSVKSPRALAMGGRLRVQFQQGRDVGRTHGGAGASTGSDLRRGGEVRRKTAMVQYGTILARWEAKNGANSGRGAAVAQASACAAPHKLNLVLQVPCANRRNHRTSETGASA